MLAAEIPPPPGPDEAFYVERVAPWIEAECARCHRGTDAGGFRLQLPTGNVSDEDRRSTILSPTSRGHDMVERVAPVMINRQSELMSSLTEAEHEALIKALDKLEAAVENSKLGDKG